MKTKEDYKRALTLIGDAVRAWDPERLIAGGAPRNEYEAEAAKVATLVPRMRSPKDAAIALSKIFTASFNNKSYTPDYCANAGGKVYEVLKANGLLPE
ncbi:MAG: DUF1871 family protein [Planctomycetota bacterium]|nr:DUF1871 family protein [Planctomycetota bacterium]